MVLKAGAAGDLVKLKDVGRAELGAERYSTFARLQRPSGGGVPNFANPRQQLSGHCQGGEGGDGAAGGTAFPQG